MSERADPFETILRYAKEEPNKLLSICIREDGRLIASPVTARNAMAHIVKLCDLMQFGENAVLVVSEFNPAPQTDNPERN